MATTTNFGWETPDDTDLVKDGALAMRTLGNSIDTSFVDLKGGTTGQVLSKASNTDLDFTWVAQDDSNAIQNTIVDAKGDLIAASAADTPARLAVGNNGETLVADSSTTTGLRWQGNYAAGKNIVINGDFRIWQRGTSGFSLGGAYNSDRWAFYRDGSGATDAITQQSFTAGAAPVAGYEAPFFWRYSATVAGTGGTERSLYQRIEDVRTFANQTVTVSFWAKADATRTITLSLSQNFGSGGSTSVTTSLTSQSVTTSWARYSATVAVPSVSGKTIGTSSYLQLLLGFPINVTETIDIWGVQLEAGLVATAFQTATGTLAGELAACQRYYQQIVNGNTQNIGVGWNYSASYSICMLYLPVKMRVEPTLSVTSGTNFYAFERNGGLDYINGFFGAANNNPNNTFTLRNSTEVSGTAGHAGFYLTDNASANISLSAEL